MGQAYNSDERKYIKAIDDYTSKRITYSQFLDKTIPLKNVSRRVRDTFTVTGKKLQGLPFGYDKGGKDEKDDTNNTEGNIITLKQLQLFFKACNIRLQRIDDSITRGEKVQRSILKMGNHQLNTINVSLWLRKKFSKTPAVLQSFHEVAVSLWF